MPSIPFPGLIDRFKASLERGGATVIQAGDTEAKPARLRVVNGDRTTDCLVFLWTITGGGGGPDVRPAAERRIQVTAAERFPLQLGVRTIIGGYYPDEDVFGFWDVLQHTRFSKKSPSFQMNAGTLERAAHEGVATQFRKTKPPELVVAVRPDLLLWYVEQGIEIHNLRGNYAGGIADLATATPEEERDFLDCSETPDEAQRRYNLVEIMRAYRDAKFRPLVLQAYRHRCAVCGVALKLVDAAHIVPVTHPKSKDDPTNGLGLCRLHHAAYDNALLGIKPDYSIVINPAAISRLTELKLMQGFDNFKLCLPARITTPAEEEIRPRSDYLAVGMEARNWPADLID